MRDRERPADPLALDGMADRTIIVGSASKELRGRGAPDPDVLMWMATGVGPLLQDKVVRLILGLKIASLCQGHSGVRWVVVDALRTKR